MKIDLIIPKLLLPQDAFATDRSSQQPVRARTLAYLLSRGNVTFSPLPLTEWLAQQWGTPALPVAPVTAYADGLDTGNWLRADPAHLRVQRDNVQLLDAAILDIQADETTLLIATLNQHFASDGLVFHAPTPDRWYVAVPENEMPTTHAIDDVIGKAVFDHQPTSRGKINWKAIANEIQMLLFEHPVNLARDVAGKFAINGVWFWGGGEASVTAPKPKWNSIFGQEPYLAGLSRLSHTEIMKVPETANELAILQETHLVLLNALDVPARRNDMDAWNAALIDLETTWFLPLYELLKNRKIVALKLHLPTDNGMVSAELTPNSLWKIWRSTKPLPSYLHE